MKPTLLLASLCLAIAAPIAARGSGISIEPASDTYFETEPRNVVTAAFHVTNTSPHRLDLAGAVRLPPGWTLVAEDARLSLYEDQSDIGLVSFLVPRSAAAGRYRIGYRIQVVDDPSMADSSTIDLHVLPVRRLEVALLEAEGRIVAGEAYRARFVVANLGNTEVAVSLSLIHTVALVLQLSPNHLNLLPGQAVVAEVTAETDPEIRRSVRGGITLAVTVAGDIRPAAKAAAFLEVVPRVTGTEDAYRRIPSGVTLKHVYERNARTASKFQAEVSGSGNLDQAGRSELTYLWRGPDIGQNMIMGTRDEFFAAYTRDHFRMALGDQGYSVSPLIEGHHFARGIKSELDINNVHAGAYHFDTRGDELQESQTGVFADYDLGIGNRIGINYLRKDETSKSDIAGAEVNWDILGKAALEAEYATALDGEDASDAYRVRCRGLHDHVSYLLRYIHAEPAFSGYFRGLEFFAASLDIEVGRGISLDMGLKRERRSLDSDTLSFPTHRDRAYQVRVAYRRKSGLDAAVLARRQEYEGRLSESGFGYVEESVRPSMGQRFRAWNYSLSFEAGRAEDRPTGGTSRLARYTASVTVRPGQMHSYRGYVFYDNNVYPGQERHSRITAGLCASVNVNASTSVDLSIRYEDYANSMEQSRSILELALGQGLARLGKVRLRGHYTTYAGGGNPDHLALMAEYALPFGLPVGKKQTIGIVRGRIYDEETGNPVVGALLKLDGATAVSDHEGRFTFPSIAAGRYHLDLEIGSVGMNKITRQKMPMRLDVRGGETTSLAIPIVRGCTLEGQAVLFAFEDTHNITLPGRKPAAPVDAGGLANAMVEITDGMETRRTVTDDDGRFRFEEIRPGTWDLAIPDRDIPDYHYIEEYPQTLELTPGESQELTLRVLPTKRPIRIIHEGPPIVETP